MNKEQLLDCKYHHYPYIWSFQRGKKCKCKSCMQSKKDSDICFDINESHINGVLCDKWTQCSACSRIKFHKRVLKHFAYNGEKCGRNCDICRYKEETVDKYRKDIERIVIEIYGWFFGCDVIRSRRIIARRRGIGV